MAIVDDFDQNISFHKPRKVEENPNFKHHDEMGLSVLNNKETKLDDIIQYIGGYKWKGTYYNNLSGPNDKTVTHSPLIEKTIQKYNKIENIVIFLESTIDKNAKLEDLTITAKINAAILPFEEDLFISNMIGGRIAIFRVTKVETVTYQIHDIYKIELRFYQFLDNYKKEILDLESKVVHTYYYDTRFIINYGSPILLKEEYKDFLDLSGFRAKLINKFITLFLDKRNSMINIFASPHVINGIRYEEMATFLDPYVIRFFRKITNVEDDHRLLNISYPIEDDTYEYNHETILDIILNGGKFSDMMFIQKKLSWNRLRNTFSESNPSLRNLCYLDIDRIMDVNIGDNPPTLTEQAKEYLFSRSEEDINYPLKLETDGYYIFSKEFYEEDVANMTDFERLIHSYLSFENIDFNKLKEYIKSFTMWSKHEMFYVIPILIHLINTLSRETHSSR